MPRKRFGFAGGNETSDKGSKQLLEIRRHLGVMFGLDLVVYRSKRLKERADKVNWFVRDILEEGKVVYKADNN
jgi:hypothetical protein